MWNSFLIWVVAVGIFLVLDAIWLGVISKRMYREKLGHLMSDKPNLLVAVLFYLFFIFGLVFFVIKPSIDAANITYAILAGLLFGAVTYGTYDLTNLATMKRWPVVVTIVDILWGSVLCGVVSLLTYLIFV